MTTSEIFLLVLALIFLWELYAVLFVNRTVKIPGVVPFRKQSMLVTAVVFPVILLIRWGVDTMSLLCCGVFVVVMLLFLFIRAGLGEQGVVSSGSVLTFDRVRYYAVELEDNAGVRIRFNSVRREITLLFKKEQVAAVEACMAQNKIPTAKAYADKKKKQPR